MKTWIFQGNPDRFDVDTYLTSQNEIYWSVTRPAHQDLVAVGDRVFIWRAKGKANAIPGIVAIGYVTQPCRPKSQVENPELLSDHLWNVETVGVSEVKAGINLDEVRLSPSEGMLTLTEIRKDPLLSQMHIVKARTGSNFLLTPEQTERILQMWDTIQAISLDIPQFVHGTVYTRTLLHDKFGGQRYGGISTPKSHNAIFIFTGEVEEQYGYADGWRDESTFYYTGEGQSGDMTLTKGNLAIANQDQDGKDLFLFQHVSPGKVQYIDQMFCIGYHFEDGIEKQGNVRKIIIFELTRFTDIARETREQSPIYHASTESLEQLREKALKSAASGKTPSERRAIYYARSKAIKDYALRRAGGLCEGCNQSAPFTTNSGEPYLEVHHIRRLTDGGPDHPEWVIAVCPNCHRRAHYSSDSTNFNDLLKSKAAAKEQSIH